MIDKAGSLYLECLRIIAAVYVFLYHMGSEKVGDVTYMATPLFNRRLHLNYFGAHFFVIIFFVLSGFLISISAHKPSSTFKNFIISRLGRLYSVLLPALVFSFMCSFLLVSIHALPADLKNYDHPVSRFFVNAAFLSQVWNLCATPPVTYQSWSISYEFIYYLLLAALVFTKGRKKAFWFLLVCCIAGLKILLLFPCWAIGAVLYKVIKKEYRFNTILSVCLFLASSAIIIFTLLFPLKFPFINGQYGARMFGFDLFYSWNYKADYLFSLVMAINMFSFFSFSRQLCSTALVQNKNFHKIIFSAGNSTYTLYLFHLPLLFLFASLPFYNKANVMHQVIMILAIFVTVYFLALVTEKKVQLWRGWIFKIVNSFLSSSRKLPGTIKQ